MTFSQYDDGDDNDYIIITVVVVVVIIIIIIVLLLVRVGSQVRLDVYGLDSDGCFGVQLNLSTQPCR